MNMKRRHFTRTLAAAIPVAAFGTKLFASSEDKQRCTLWQLPPQTRSQMNSYVMRTPGNELIVIDGGRKEDAAYLRTFIRERGNHVHAWFISHPHLDHVDALTAIINDPGDMTIDRIYGSLPDDDWLEEHQNANADKTQLRLKAALQKSNRKLLDLSPGQRIEFKGASFEILSTLNPELTVNAVNNQSAVWRVDVGNTSLLFLGDLGVEGGDKLLAGPYRSRLKADYVQMSHHGQAGVSEEFYKVVNPKQCLWPTPDWLWDNNKRGQGRDSGPWKTLEVRAWMDKLNVEKHYVAKDGLHQIDIPVLTARTESRAPNNRVETDPPNADGSAGVGH
jgi:beta-lactamase superfamily II metal-dependent hydrolase